MVCRICKASTAPFGTATTRRRYLAEYVRCTCCGSVQVAEPIWLDESYETPVNETDIGLVSRNLEHAAVTTALITLFFDRSGRFLDYGGGYGLLVRLMRDRGFDFRYFDRHPSNLFARSFTIELPTDGEYELLTAFEVFEHLVDPCGEIETMLSCSKSILFTTELMADPPPAPGTWWYHATEHGQHVTFYTLMALDVLAKSHGLNLYTNTRNVHLLTRKRIPASLFRMVTRLSFATLLSALRPRRSLLQKDYALANMSDGTGE